ncbi:MAG: FlgD immunoglobulin-like domain containing protein [Candidatus Latescibacterota bacterium]
MLTGRVLGAAAASVGLLTFSLGAGAAAAGQNAGVEVGLGVTSPSCRLRGGDRVELVVAGRHMAGVRQVRLDFSWQPPDAVVSATGRAAGVAEAAHFMVPGPPQILDNQAQFGMASFSEAVDGEGVLTQLAFELAPHVDAGTPVDIRLERVLLGPTSVERDTIIPDQAVALANYCDAAGLPLERGVFIRPPRQRARLSPPGSGPVGDGSRGEVLVSGRLLQGGAFQPGQRITWTISNAGSVPVYVLAAARTLTVAPGERQLGVAQGDARGDAYLLLDAEAGPVLAGGTADLVACSELDGESLCASGQVIWEEATTAVTETGGAALPDKVRLDLPYPNPFNAVTVVPIAVPEGLEADLTVDVLDLAGQVVQVLVSSGLDPGRHLLTWNGRNGRGHAVASGIYWCRLRWPGGRQVQPLVLLR